MVKVVMRSREGEGSPDEAGLEQTAIPIPYPTNLALFGHKITLYRFNQGLILLWGAQMGAGG